MSFPTQKNVINMNNKHFNMNFKLMTHHLVLINTSLFEQNKKFELSIILRKKYCLKSIRISDRWCRSSKITNNQVRTADPKKLNRFKIFRMKSSKFSLQVLESALAEEKHKRKRTNVE